MVSMSMNKIQMLLLAGANNVNRDTAIFHQWERGEITTAKCLKMFRQNNRQNDRVDISQEDFEKWLNSLGYIRR